MTDRIALSGLTIRAGTATLVDGVGVEVEAGQVVALVGRSGSGKSLTARALLGMVDLDPGVVAADLAITVDGLTRRPYDGARPGRRPPAQEPIPRRAGLRTITRRRGSLRRAPALRSRSRPGAPP